MRDPLYAGYSYVGVRTVIVYAMAVIFLILFFISVMSNSVLCYV